MLLNTRAKPAAIVNYPPCVINSGTSREPEKSMPDLLRDGTKSGGQVKQLCPIRQQLACKANRLQALVGFRAHNYGQHEAVYRSGGDSQVSKRGAER